MKTKAAIIFWAWTWLAPVCAGSLHAQSIPVNTKMGKVSVEECAMDSFPPDTSASALVLYEDHSLKIDYNLSLGIPIQRTTHRERIKILKEDAMDYCDYSMMISRDSDDMESISSISVVTYNLEGGKVVATKMPRSNIFWTKYNDHFDKVSFAAQNVRVGSVVEVYYDMDTGRVMNIDDFYFQRSIPVNLCVYTVTLPRWLEFKSSPSKRISRMAWTWGPSSRTTPWMSRNIRPWTFRHWTRNPVYTAPACIVLPCPLM